MTAGAMRFVITPRYTRSVTVNLLVLTLDGHFVGYVPQNHIGPSLQNLETLSPVRIESAGAGQSHSFLFTLRTSRVTVHTNLNANPVSTFITMRAQLGSLLLVAESILPMKSVRTELRIDAVCSLQHVSRRTSQTFDLTSISLPNTSGWTLHLEQDTISVSAHIVRGTGSPFVTAELLLWVQVIVDGASLHTFVGVRAQPTGRNVLWDLQLNVLQLPFIGFGARTAEARDEREKHGKFICVGCFHFFKSCSYLMLY